ncbi:MAG TPA: protein phosphatase CheZ [Acetobacteraceae bacterium]|nr:protein phosphatase CheZ [Acetobacteraceae bacterium]
MADRTARPDAVLAKRLAAIRERYADSDPDMVADVVRAILTTMSGDLTAQETSLLSEVESLGQIIAATKSEIAALRMDDITVSDIPFATDELDAIIHHTASATHAILETCETLDAVAEHLAGEPAAAQLQDATTRIYEACSFQDITGQRITKVVNTLKAIEAKVCQLVQTFGDHRSDAAAESGAQGEAALLNGPQLPTVAMDQSDIDKLLASFE